MGVKEGRDTAADFDFLSLDRLTRGTFTATTTRLSDQDAENTFCRHILLLGGRRWPSLDRFRLVLNAVAYDSLALEWAEDGTAPTPTSEERGWVSVARVARPPLSLAPSEGFAGRDQIGDVATEICVAEIPRRLAELGNYDEQSTEQ
ncbi:hypothetical protein PG984_015665 [Apiospora sp. TS-2023a]